MNTVLGAVAVMRQLDPQMLEAQVAAARSLAAMRTRERVLRLQSPDRKDCLAPQPLRSAAELATAEVLARELWAARDRLGEDFDIWIAATLLSASRNKPGVRIASPALLARWLRAARIGNTRRRWRVDLEAPADGAAPALDAWVAAASGADVDQRAVRDRRSVVAKVRLPRPDIEARTPASTRSPSSTPPARPVSPPICSRSWRASRPASSNGPCVPQRQGETNGACRRRKKAFLRIIVQACLNRRVRDTLAHLSDCPPVITAASCFMAWFT